MTRFCANPECQKEIPDERAKYCSDYCGKRARNLRFQQRHGKRVRKQKPKNTKPRFFHATRSPYNERQRINNVIAKAIHAGTCYNLATLAPTA